MNMTPEERKADEALVARIKSAYNDAGELHLYDKDGNDIYEWPKSWPERIGHVATFLKERGIFLHA
jgi:hypothetical protein